MMRHLLRHGWLGLLGLAWAAAPRRPTRGGTDPDQRQLGLRLGASTWSRPVGVRRPGGAVVLVLPGGPEPRGPAGAARFRTGRPSPPPASPRDAEHAGRPARPGADRLLPPRPGRRGDQLLHALRTRHSRVPFGKDGLGRNAAGGVPDFRACPANRVTPAPNMPMSAMIATRKPEDAARMPTIAHITPLALPNAPELRPFTRAMTPQQQDRVAGRRRGRWADAAEQAQIAGRHGPNLDADRGDEAGPPAGSLRSSSSSPPPAAARAVVLVIFIFVRRAAAWRGRSSSSWSAWPRQHDAAPEQSQPHAWHVVRPRSLEVPGRPDR